MKLDIMSVVDFQEEVLREETSHEVTQDCVKFSNFLLRYAVTNNYELPDFEITLTDYYCTQAILKTINSIYGRYPSEILEDRVVL